MVPLETVVEAETAHALEVFVDAYLEERVELSDLALFAEPSGRNKTMVAFLVDQAHGGDALQEALTLSDNSLILFDPESALMWASGEGHVSVVRALLEIGANPRAVNDTPLKSAARRGHTEVVRALIEAGANVQASRNHALRFAAENGHADVVRLLLESGANIHARDDAPLRAARWYGHEDVVLILQDWIEEHG